MHVRNVCGSTSGSCDRAASRDAALHRMRGPVSQMSGTLKTVSGMGGRYVNGLCQAVLSGQGQRVDLHTANDPCKEVDWCVSFCAGD